MMVFYWSYGGLLLFCDVYKWPRWLYRQKIQPKTSFEIRGAKSNPPLWKLFAVVLFNQVFVLLPGMYLLDYVTRSGWIPFCSGIRVTEKLPSVFEMIRSIGLALLMLEVLFYYSHRLLHHPAIYSAVHKLHHDFRAPVALAAIYAHPIEAIFSNLICVMGPAFFSSFHLYTWYWGLIIGWLGTMNDHSGYFIQSNFLKGFHDWHHETFTGNFGSLRLLDWLHGTDGAWKRARQQQLDRAAAK